MNTIRSSSRGSADGTHPAARALRRAARLSLAGALAMALASCGTPSSKTKASGGAQGGAAAPSASHGEVGSIAPEFNLPDLTGARVASSTFKGKVVILDFWATWCPPCREEIPHLVKLQAKYRDQGLAIVGLSLDAGGANDVKPFAEEHDVNYTMLIANEEVARSYGNVMAVPTTFVLDRNGRIVQRFIGYTAPEVFEQTIKPLLAAS